MKKGIEDCFVFGFNFLLFVLMSLWLENSHGKGRLERLFDSDLSRRVCFPLFPCPLERCCLNVHWANSLRHRPIYAVPRKSNLEKFKVFVSLCQAITPSTTFPPLISIFHQHPIYNNKYTTNLPFQISALCTRRNSPKKTRDIFPLPIQLNQDFLNKVPSSLAPFVIVDFGLP